MPSLVRRGIQHLESIRPPYPAKQLQWSSYPEFPKEYSTSLLEVQMSHHPSHASHQDTSAPHILRAAVRWSIGWVYKINDRIALKYTTDPDNEGFKKELDSSTFRET